MKIILSRKGFDSTAGGIPSPIMPGEKLLSLPIPVLSNDENGTSYRELRFDGQPLDQIIHQLWNTPRRPHPFQYEQAHLDPDLDPGRFVRPRRDWEPTFGQTGRPQGHLRNEEVGVGDLFLFYGWFKRAELENGEWRYVRRATDLHVIFGWLHVGERLRVNQGEAGNRIPYHPHIRNTDLYGDDNTIYVARDKLNLNGKDSAIAGAGIFSQFNDALRLTAPDEHRRSYWRLSRWFYPFGNRPRTPLTCHGNPHRWTLNNDHVILRSVSPGQEFVFDTGEYPEAVGWIRSLFQP